MASLASGASAGAKSGSSTTPTFPSTPQVFSFGTLELAGYTLSYTGRTRRRKATHVYLKRDGAAEEDMGQDQRGLKVRLLFSGTDCAKQYQAFEKAVSKKPSQLLTHPIAGQYQAFCGGPDHSIDLGKSINQIECEVEFSEDQLDGLIPNDAPDVGTAQQNAQAQQLAMQRSIAEYIISLAKSQTASPLQLNPLDTAMNAIAGLTTSPVSTTIAVVNSTLGVASSIASLLATIDAANTAMVSAVDSFIEAASTLFDGESDTSSSGVAESIDSWIGTVADNTITLEDAVLAAQPTPAGCADAFADIELMLEACMTLQDAVAAAQPPTAQMIVPVTMSLVAFAQNVIAELDLNYDALALASSILGLNRRISNLSAIPGGTVLTVPTA